MRRLIPARRQVPMGAWSTGMALLVTVGLAPTAWAQNQIFVSNYYGDSITVYSRKASGEIAPSSTIAGVYGDRPHHAAINHRAGELVVANNNAYTVSVYDMATGSRKRTIAGPSTGLFSPTGILVDEINGEIYVTNDFGDNVTVYDVLANGDTPPKRAFKSTGYIFHPVGLAIDLKNDEIVVANDGNSTITTFDRLASGDATPKRVISSPDMYLPQGIAIDPVNDELLVANSRFVTANAGSILTFWRTDSGYLSPHRTLEGNATQLCNPISVALDVAVNEIVVANSNFGSGTCAQSVTTYDRTAANNAAPKRMIAGPLTALNYPVSATITSALSSNVTVKVKAVQNPVSAGSTIAFAIDTVANGAQLFGVTLNDTLPVGPTWLVGGSASTACTILNGKLTCLFGDMPKGTTKSIILSATGATCPGVSTSATAFYNDGTAYLGTVSPTTANINIKCR